MFNKPTEHLQGNSNQQNIYREFLPTEHLQGNSNQHNIYREILTNRTFTGEF